MINEDFQAVIRNNDRGSYLGSQAQEINRNNITAERKKQAETAKPKYDEQPHQDGAITK